MIDVQPTKRQDLAFAYWGVEHTNLPIHIRSAIPLAMDAELFTNALFRELPTSSWVASSR